MVTSDPADVLDRIGYLLEEVHESTYRVKAYRGAAAAVRRVEPVELTERAIAGTLTELAAVGPKTAAVITAVLAGQVPEELVRLEAERAARVAEEREAPGAALRQALKGDCHTHSDWSDGGSPIEVMARAAQAIGHEYLVLTDHSPRLKVANGLDADRLRRQLDEVARVNELLSPFRLLTGIEVDILDDGTLDQDPALLAQLDVVVASVHSKLAMEERAMTRRLCVALANPAVDILGHCTNRIVVGKGRKPSTFDAELVFQAAASFDKAVEINSRPERLDPPMELLALLVEGGVKVSIDTDAHAPGQLEWQRFGCARAERAGLPPELVVNTWEVDDLLAWTGSHA